MINFSKLNALLGHLLLLEATASKQTNSSYYIGWRYQFADKIVNTLEHKHTAF